MSDQIEIEIGGVRHLLVKTPNRFHVLAPTPGAINRLREAQDVVGLHIDPTQTIARVATSASASVDEWMAELRTDHVSHHEYMFKSDDMTQRFIPTGKLHVRAKDPLRSTIDRLVDRYSLKRNPDPVFGEYVTLELTNDTPMNPVRLCAELQTDPDLLYAEPDYLFRVEACAGGAWLGRQWHLRPNSLIGGASLRGTDTVGAWAVTTGSPDVVIAVMDDGFDIGVRDLGGRVVEPADFGAYAGASTLPHPFVPTGEPPLPGPGNYHGTPCAGLAIAGGDDYVNGVAPGCSWMPVRIAFGLSSEDYWLKVFEYVSQRADVVSCSFAVLPSPFENLSSAMRDALSVMTASGGRRRKGLVMCFAAGNYNLPTSLDAADNGGLEYFDPQGQKLGTFFKNKPIYSKWCQAPGAIVVAACSAERTKSLYSNWGRDVTVCAPSDDWRVDSPLEHRRFGPRLVTTDNDRHGKGLYDVGVASQEFGPVTDAMGGTSGATPQVAGVCGLILSANSGLSASEVRKIVCDTAERDELSESLPAGQTPANNLGQNGKFDGDGRSTFYGRGLVSPARAVGLAVTLGTGFAGPNLEGGK